MAFLRKFKLIIPSISINKLLLSLVLFCVLSPICAQKKYGEPCSMDSECETHFCHRTKKACECGVVKDYKSGYKTEQYYHNELMMCLSRVGQSCTLESASDDGLPRFQCVPDAVCEVMSKRGNVPSTQKFGSCTCKPRYQPIENGKRCVSNVELRPPPAPSSMDQVRPEGWNRSGSSSCLSIAKRPFMTYFPAFVVIVLCCRFPFR